VANEKQWVNGVAYTWLFPVLWAVSSKFRE
jgi:hypothetical protein